MAEVDTTLDEQEKYAAELASSIAAHDEVKANTVSLSGTDVFNAAREDLNMLALVCYPDVFRYLYPVVFMAVWDWLLSFVNTERSFPRLALGLPRGFGKTAVIKLFVLYCVFFTKKQYVVIYCATLPKAINVLADICGALDTDLVRTVFGDWTSAREMDRADLKKFYFRGRPIALQAAGVGTDIRGANVHGARPDVQIFDDIQKREDAESEVETAALKTWFYDTALKTRSPFGCMYLFLGNMYATPFSLLRELVRNSTWIKFVTGAIRANGESLWEELYPITQILDEYEADVAAGREASFLAEIMNDETITASAAMDTGKIPDNRFAGEVIHQGNAIIIDPSAGKSGSDETAIGYMEIYDATPVFTDVIQGVFSPGDTIKKVLTLCMEKDCRAIFVEGNSYQETLLYWFGVVCENMGIEGITFVPLFTGHSSKNTRIMNMFPALVSGELSLGSKVKSLVTNQILSWNAAKVKNKDDLLDVCCYMIRIQAEYGEFLATTAILGRQQISSVPVRNELETNCF